MAYRVIHVSNNPNSKDSAAMNSGIHERRIQEELDKLGEKDEIYSIEHSVSKSETNSLFSTIIVYRQYEG